MLSKRSCRNAVLPLVIAALVGATPSSAGWATTLEATGRIFHIDDEADRLTLGNGQTFEFDGDASRLSLAQGACVTIAYALIDGRNVIRGITGQVPGLRRSVQDLHGSDCSDSVQPDISYPSMTTPPRRFKRRERPLPGAPRGMPVRPAQD